MERRHFTLRWKTLMNNFVVMLLFLSAMFGGPAVAQDMPPAQPTARDMYVSCFLFVHQDDVPKSNNGTFPSYSGGRCGAVSLRLISSREGAARTTAYRFCLDHSSATRSDPANAMAYAYLDYFESHPALTGNQDGTAMYLFAMIDRWPCPAK